MASVVVLYVTLLCWVFLGRGAELLAEHSELLNSGGKQTPNMVRIVVCLMLLGGIAGMAMLFAGVLDLPVGRWPNKGR